VGVGLGHVSLPIVVVPHPVADRDANLIRSRGGDIAQECVRVLTTPAAKLAQEFERRQYPLPALMPR
jgi:hypothetical protein